MPYDQILTDEWSEVALNAEIPNSLFAWQPPKGWAEWRFPRTGEEMLKPELRLPISSSPRPAASPSNCPIIVAGRCGSASGRPLPGPISSNPYRGRRADLRRVQEIYSKYKNAGLVVLGYNATDETKRALANDAPEME